jgi:hypothetical protein
MAFETIREYLGYLYPVLTAWSGCAACSGRSSRNGWPSGTLPPRSPYGPIRYISLRAGSAHSIDPDTKLVHEVELLHATRDMIRLNVTGCSVVRRGPIRCNQPLLAHDT